LYASSKSGPLILYASSAPALPNPAARNARQIAYTEQIVYPNSRAKGRNFPATDSSMQTQKKRKKTTKTKAPAVDLVETRAENCRIEEEPPQTLGAVDFCKKYLTQASSRSFHRKWFL
jgi:hypothetical protein